MVPIEATLREPETEAGRELMSLMGWSNLNLRGEVLRLVLAIEAELRAKLATEVEHLYLTRSSDPDGGHVWSAVLRLLRGDSGGAA